MLGLALYFIKIYLLYILNIHYKKYIQYKSYIYIFYLF